MDDNTPLWPEAEDIVIDLVRAAFGSDFRQYYNGEPTFIPEQLLPCIIVRPVDTDTTAQGAPTGFDIKNDAVMIKVLLNKKDDINAPPDALLTEARLKHLVGARDASTGAYLPKTILGILRANIALNGKVITQNNRIEYKFDIQADDVVTSEAWVTVTVRELVPVTRS